MNHVYVSKLFSLALMIFNLAALPALGQSEDTISDLAGTFASDHSEIAIDELERRIAEDDPDALVAAGVMHLVQNEGNDEDAFWFFQRAAEHGSVDGQYFLGRMLMEGRGVEKDLAVAERSLQLALELGHPAAAGSLEYLRAETIVRRHGGVERAFETAMELRCERFRQQGKKYVCVESDEVRADRNAIKIKILEAGMMLGHEDSALAFADLLANGWAGVERDVARAEAIRVSLLPGLRELYKRRDADDPEALYRLGELHSLDSIFFRDFDAIQRDPLAGELEENNLLAAEYFRRAALLGHADAQAQLGWLLYRGEDLADRGGGAVPTDRETSAILLQRAVGNGSSLAPELIENIESRERQALRARQREETTRAILMLLGAIVVANMDSPAQAKPTKIDNCAGMNGLGWFDPALGNAAAIFGGCRPF